MITVLIVKTVSISVMHVSLWPENQHFIQVLYASRLIFPVLLANNVRFILDVTGGASHTTVVDENERPNLTAYWAKIDTPYLLYSLTFMLCDILVWFGNYAEMHQDIQANTVLWRDLKLEGTIGQDSGNNYFVGDCLIPYGRMKYCQPGDYIEVLEYEETDPKARVEYPLTAKRIKKTE